MIYADLVLDTGELVRVECLSKFEDDFWESIYNAIKLREMWSPSRFSGCKASLMGMGLERVNMARVVGTL